MDAIREVQAEREKQRSQWGDAHDDEHVGGELVQGAIAYAVESTAPGSDWGRSWWPWRNGWNPEPDPRSNLVKAAAMLVAEIERLDRAEELASVEVWYGGPNGA